MKKLKEYNSVIQVCPVCGKVDACKGDGHSCEQEVQRQESQDYYD